MDQKTALYDVYFTGKLTENVSVKPACQSVAILFKTEPDKIEHIFNGPTQLLKRNLTKEAALKYKAVLRKAGLSILFKLSADKSQPDPLTAVNSLKSAIQTTAQAKSNGTIPKDDKQALTIAPVGSDVLTLNERKVVVPRNIDTSGIKLNSPFLDQQPEPKPNAQTPDTSHISIAEAGANMIAKPQPEPLRLDLNLDDISLSPLGALLEGLHNNLAELNPDISAISLAPVGSDILDQPPSKPESMAPDVSHISIEQP